MLGALNIATNRYCLPKQAIKGEKYKCAETGVPLLLCKGEVRIPYFRTYPTHTGEPGAPHKGIQNGESIEHKNAKHIVSYFLQQGGHVPIERSCICCKAGGRYEKPGYTGHFVIEFRGVQDVMEEMPCENGRADIGFTNYDGDKWLVEIIHTHATTHREGNWVELNAKQVITQWEAKNGFFLSCVRPYKCDECAEKDEAVRLNEIRLAEQRLIEERRREAQRQKEQERIRLEGVEAYRKHIRVSYLKNVLTHHFRRRRLERQAKEQLAELKTYSKQQEFLRRQRIADENIERMRQVEAERIRKEKWDADAPLRAERKVWADTYNAWKEQHRNWCRAHAQKGRRQRGETPTPAIYDATEPQYTANPPTLHPNRDPRFANFSPYSSP